MNQGGDAAWRERESLRGAHKPLGLILSILEPALRVHICNPSPQEEKAEGSEVQGYPQLPREFEASLGYRKPYQNNRTLIKYKK